MNASRRPPPRSPDHGRAGPTHVRPGTVQLPASPRPASGASSGSPEPASQPQRNRSRPLPTPRQDAPQATATGRRRDHPRARAHRRRGDRAGAQAAPTIARTIPERRHRGATIPAPIPPTIPRVAIDTRRQPARAKRTTSRRQAHARRHRHSVAASAPATDAATQQSGRIIAGTGPELHAGERRPLATADQRALANKRQQRRPDPPTPSSSSGTSTQVSKAALKSLVTGAGTCGCQ